LNVALAQAVHPAEMDLAEDDHVIQALAADRPDQPFDKAILLW
jgi:hypothetical protein